MKEPTLQEALARISGKGEEERLTIAAAVKVSGIIEKIVQARRNKNLTQRDVAKICGVPQSTIARMETLSVIPKLDTLVLIAESLNVEIKAEEKEDMGACSVSRSMPNIVYLWRPMMESDRYCLAQ